MPAKCLTSEFCKSVASLSEKELISRICARFVPRVLPAPMGPGDDCAVIDPSIFKGKMLSTSDAVILGRHFDFNTPGYDAGMKAMNRNVSDIASMGGEPIYAMTSAILGSDVSLEWLDDFCTGMRDAAAEWGIKFIGGDLARVDKGFFSMHMTLLGNALRPLLRSGAKMGDHIFVTGPLGASYESGRHLHFKPRVKEGLFLASCGQISACTDLSDGLASDLRNIIPQGACAEIYSDRIPIYPNQANSLKKALVDGEDYELLFTASDCEFLDDYVSCFGNEASYIGEIKIAPNPSACGAIYLCDKNSKTILNLQGFSHFGNA